MSIYSERVFAWYKPIRNKIRKFTRLSLIQETTILLHELDNSGSNANFIEMMRTCRPWSLLQIIKWSIADGEPIEFGLKVAKRNDINIIINLLNDLECHVRLPTEYSDAHSFFKTIAYQQFWLQKAPDIGHFGRQYLLNILDNGKIRNRFFNETGIKLEIFLEIFQYVSSVFLARRTHVVPVDSITTLKRHYGEQNTFASLKLFSASLEETKEIIRSQDERIKDWDMRMYEHTPLLQCPLLRIDSGTYVCYFPRLLYSAMSTCIYDILKKRDSVGFVAEFGLLFEKYISVGLKELGKPYWGEHEIQAIIGSESKCVDFALQEEGSDSLILIESKGIEMPVLAAVSPNRIIVDQRLKDTVYKAIIQAFVTANALQKNSGHPLTGKKKHIHVLVVTYKALYLGNGDDFIVKDLKDKLKSFCDANGIDAALIPASRIHFLSAEEYEALITRTTNASLNDFLVEVEQTNTAPETAKFDFGQHLTGVMPPTFIRENFELAADTLVKRFNGKLVP